MSTTATVVAVTEMVRAKFEANPLDRLIGQPNFGSVHQMVDQLAAIVSSFPTTQWGGNHGYLPLVLGQAKMRLVTKDNNITCTKITKPDKTSSKITKDSNAKEIITYQDENKLLWQEYEFQQAINSVGVEYMVSAVDGQYVDDKKEDYIAFKNQTILSLLTHLRTWFKISNKEKIDIKARFHAPWSDTPDAHASTFGRQLDRRQADCVELGVVATDEDKVIHFIDNMYASELFETKTMEDWEDATDQTWTTTLALFTAEYGKIQRSLERTSKRKDYDSAAALRDSTTRPTTMSLGTPPNTSVPETTSPAYVAMSEYAAALEEKMIELETVAETQSVITDTTDFAASATTSHITAEMAEMRAAAKSTAADLKKLTALVANMASNNGGGGKGGGGGSGGGRGGGDRRKKGATHKCKHCKREVYHKDANCLELEANKANRYASWKSVFAE